jgi:PIN domain nuclease of toxin-antitoxin system
VRVLLDTNAWLWIIAAPQRLGATARELVEDRRNELFLSAVSSWEIVIKHAMGRVDLPAPPEALIPAQMRSSGVTGLPVEHAHALRVGSLPTHHRDPFDRLLIAQAQIESLAILTADPVFGRYAVEVVRAA